MNDANPALKVWFAFDEATETHMAVATTGRLQASLYLGVPTWAVAAERREPPETMCLAQPGVVFVETGPFSRTYAPRDRNAQRGAA